MKTSKARQFIEERIDDTEKELQAIEDALKDFRIQNRRIENSPSLLLEEQRLNREVTVLRGVFTTLKQQLQTTKIEEVKESDYVIILDAPELPLEKSKPNKKMMVILAGILGIGLGLMLAFLREYASNCDEELGKKMREVKFILLKNIKELFLMRK